MPRSKNLLPANTRHATLTATMLSSTRNARLTCLLAMSVTLAGCSASASNSVFFGKSDPPRENVLRYVSGSEPETLDPQIPPLQNEARICLAVYEGLAEY